MTVECPFSVMTDILFKARCLVSGGKISVKSVDILQFCKTQTWATKLRLNHLILGLDVLSPTPSVRHLTTSGHRVKLALIVHGVMCRCWVGEGGHQRGGETGVAAASALRLRDWGLNLWCFLWPEASCWGGIPLRDRRPSWRPPGFTSERTRGLWPLKAARYGRTDKHCNDAGHAAQRAGAPHVRRRREQKQREKLTPGS